MDYRKQSNGRLTFLEHWNIVIVAAIALVASQVLGVLGGGCSQKDNGLIVPGKSVGPYRLHAEMPEVQDGIRSAYARAGAKGLLLSFKGDSISVISVLSTNYHTKEGLCLGSTQRQVFAAYGEPDRKSTNASNCFWDYQGRGIQICCSDGKVILINVLDDWGSNSGTSMDHSSKR